MTLDTACVRRWRFRCRCIAGERCGPNWRSAQRGHHREFSVSVLSAALERLQDAEQPHGRDAHRKQERLQATGHPHFRSDRTSARMTEKATTTGDSRTTKTATMNSSGKPT
jgi:hypothetical protein